MSDVKRISIKEFRELGYLQELNRQFLHPLGLALEVTVSDDVEEAEVLGGIWDYRDDPEGLRYNLANSEHLPPQRLRVAREKAEHVQREVDARRPVREAALGYWVEPIPEEQS